MKKIHAALIAAAVAFAVMAGAFAAFRTTRLGLSSRQHVSPVALAAQSRALDRAEAALRQSLHSRPPALPALPKVTRIAPVVTTVPPKTTTRTSPVGRGDDGEHGEGSDD
jgi:hypothetical protein